MDFIIGENHDLWNVALDGPTFPTKLGKDGKTQVPKGRLELDANDKINVQKDWNQN